MTVFVFSCGLPYHILLFALYSHVKEINTVLTKIFAWILKTIGYGYCTSPIWYRIFHLTVGYMAITAHRHLWVWKSRARKQQNKAAKHRNCESAKPLKYETTDVRDCETTKVGNNKTTEVRSNEIVYGHCHLGVHFDLILRNLAQGLHIIYLVIFFRSWTKTLLHKRPSLQTIKMMTDTSFA